jgi:hypothetical protein
MCQMLCCAGKTALDKDKNAVVTEALGDSQAGTKLTSI